MKLSRQRYKGIARSPTVTPYLRASTAHAFDNIAKVTEIDKLLYGEKREKEKEKERETFSSRRAKSSLGDAVGCKHL